MKLVLEWIKEKGGVAAVEKEHEERYRKLAENIIAILSEKELLYSELKKKTKKTDPGTGRKDFPACAFV